MTNEEVAKKLAERIAQQVTRGAGKGLKAAASFLASRVKEELSHPAPRARVKDPYTGEFVYVATKPATAGAPPRKLSGRLRSSITWQMRDETTAVVGTNVVYAKQLEFGGPINPKNKSVLRWVSPATVGMSKSGKTKYGGKSVFSKGIVQKPHPFLSTTAEKYKDHLAVIVGKSVTMGFK